MRRWVVVGVGALVVAGAAQAGISRLGGRSAAARGGPVAAPAGPAVGGRAGSVPAAGAATAADGSASNGAVSAAPGAPVPAPATAPGGGSDVPIAQPKVVRTAEMDIQVAAGTFAAAFDRVSSVAAANGGFVASSSSSTGGRAHAGSLDLRVPSDRFDTAREAVRALGKVQGESLRGQDVSGQLVDYDARITSLTAQEDALRTILSSAKAVGDVLSVQSSLFGVRQQIEQLQAARASLDQSATFSSITVALSEPGAAVTTPPRPARGLAHSLRLAADGALAVVGGMIVVTGWAVPVAGVGLLVWGIGWLLRRRSLRRLPAT
ncbi:MAG: DUF4349 domain-containing protein [Acidimicrobiales bacterium]